MFLKSNFGNSLKIRMERITSYVPELYDLLRSQGSRLTLLGRLTNLALKIGFKLIIFQKKRKIAATKDFLPKDKDTDGAAWLKPLTSVSADKGQRILIIAEVNLPQCFKYRVKQKIEMLEYLGYEVTMCSWCDYAKAREYLQTHGMIFFYRVPAFPEIKQLLAECERLALETFFDVDDLIFDIKEYSKNSNIANMSNKERKELFKGVELYLYTLKHCRHAIASTPVVAHYMEMHTKGTVYVVENCLDQQMFQLKRDIVKSALVRNKEWVVIGYGSGTTTHDVDFLQCSNAILKILVHYPHVKLTVHGHLQLPKEYDDFAAQIFRVPFLLANDYFKALSTFDINIAPLEKTIFNDAKSNIKFLEASIFKIPTVASPAAAFKQVVDQGKNGFLCDSEDEWYAALSRLVEDENLRAGMGQAARESAINLYDYRKIADRQLRPIVNKFVPNRKPLKRILIANIVFSPISFGGATIVTEELARLINEAPGFEVIVFTGFWDDCGMGIPPEELVRYEALGIQVIGVRLPPIMTSELEYYNKVIADKFLTVLQTVQPDIAHFHSIQQLGAGLAESCLALNIPYVVTLHDVWWLCERQFMVMENGQYCNQYPVDLRKCAVDCSVNSAHTYSRYYYLRKILQDADMLLTPSQFQKDLYVANGFTEAQIKVNKNGVLPPGHVFCKKKDRKVRFAYLGGKAEHKGYYWLKNIFEDIELTNYSLHLTDIQRAIGAPAIQESDWDIKGELIISAGFDRNTIDDFFENVDVLLFPSQWKESFGLTVREALIRDVWVITTDSGGPVEDVIPGVNGEIFDWDDIEGFKGALIEAIKNPKTINNPQKNSIRLFAEQARELRGFYDAIC